MAHHRVISLILVLASLLAVPLVAHAQAPAFLWAQPFIRSTSGQGAGPTAGAKAAVDAAGNTYLVGSFYGLVRFGSLTLTSTGANDVFVAKLDGAGNYLWATAAGGADEEQGLGIALDAQNNVYVTGSFRSQPAVFGTSSISTASGDKDVFVAKLSPTGQWLWAARGGGAGDDVGQGIATDGSRVFLTGYSRSATASFGTSALVNATTVSSFVFAASLNGSTGAWNWASGSTGPGGGQASGGAGYAVAADGSGGAYVVGDYGILATFGGTTLRTAGDFHDVFVARLSSAGTWLWAVNGSGRGDDYGLDIAVDLGGNPYIAGYFMSAQLQLGTLTLASASNNADVFVAKMTPTGTFQWATRGGGVGGEGAFALAVDAAGNAYVAGTFGPGPTSFGSTTLTSSGGQDAFVAKLGSTGAWQWALAGGSPTDDTCNGVGVDGNGNASLAGTFANPISPAVFGPYAVVGNPTSTTGFVARVGIPQTVRLSGDSLLCAGGQLQLLATPSAPATAYAWSTGATTPSITVTQPGTYTVTVTFPGGLIRQASYRVTSIAPTVSLTGDTLVCAGQPVALTAHAPGATGYVWSTGATGATISVAQPGRYTVTARYGAGCSVTAQTVVQAPSLRISGASAWCAGSSQVLTALAPGTRTFRWNTGATTPGITITQPGTYTVTASFANGCTASATQLVAVSEVTIQGDSVLCPGGSVQLTAGLPTATAYAWSTGATTASIVVTQPGQYTVTARYGAGCTRTAQVRIRLGSPLPSLTLGADTTLCEGATLVLTAPAGATTYRWSTGETTAAIRVTQPGVYSVTAATACESRSLSRRIAYQSCVRIPNVVTANGDGYNDQFAPQGLGPGPWALTIYNRWGQRVYETNDYQNSWGSEAASGLYYYLLRQAGATAQVWKGWVEVLR